MSGPAGNKLIYYRIIALWVLCEAMLGGIIHGFKIPVSGLVVGSCAVTCICLLAWYVPVKGAILKATIIVAIFKMMLSPQAPPPAYIAVFFQGLLGELLFWKRRMFTLCCVVLAVLSLLESGLQRILVLTIVYGNDIWKVINNFFNGLTGQKTTTNYSLWIGGGYVVLHLVTGLLVGWWTSLLPQKIKAWTGKEKYRLPVTGNDPLILPAAGKRKSRIKRGLLIVWILLIALYVQSYFQLGRPLLPSHVSLRILVRSVIILFAWVFIVSPFLRKWLHSWLKKKQLTAQSEVQHVLSLLPATKQLVLQSWKISAGQRGWNRLSNALKIILTNALEPRSTPQAIYILSGPVQTGKTTLLMDWIKNKKEVTGILTPVVEGKRVFMNIQTGEVFPMEAVEGEQEVLTIGRYVFSKINFDKAIQVVRQGMNNPGWLLIDEIGPMELRGEGFGTVLHEVINLRKEKLILVVRDKDDMPERVKAAFNVPGAAVIRSLSGLG